MASSPKCAAYQSCCSVVESGRQTRISGGHNVGLMPFECAYMEAFESPLPWGESVLNWVTSDFWFCLFLCPASHARSQSPCGVGSCPSTCVSMKVLATCNYPCFLLGCGILRWYGRFTTLPPFSQNFWGLSLIGTQDHHPPYGGVVGLSPAPRGLELGYLERMESECVCTRSLPLGSCSAGSGECQPPH